eukprot:scaffold246590_cov28-Tisochrysis_lutea.AAC.3
MPPMLLTEAIREMEPPDATLCARLASEASLVMRPILLKKSLGSAGGEVGSDGRDEPSLPAPLGHSAMPEEGRGKGDLKYLALALWLLLGSFRALS